MRSKLAMLVISGLLAAASSARGQLGGPAQPNALGGPGGLGVGQSGAGNAQGGSANADFDSLVDLIVSTVAPDTWQENGGGTGEIRPFPNGVWFDAAGELSTKLTTTQARNVSALPASPIAAARPSGSSRRASALRFVSLPRLEAEIARRMAAGERLDEEMLTLAGLRRARHLFVIPKTETELGDLIVAGPAGDWRVDRDRRLVASDSGLAVARLDDLLTLLRREWSAEQPRVFGCSINPRQAALASTQRLLDETSRTPLKPGTRREWLESVRSTLGAQDIEVFGIDPRSNAARTLVEADHHMKQLGLGIERTDAVTSYMDRVAQAMRRGDAAEALTVLRWWFVADYDAVAHSADGAAYELQGQGVRVLSENQLLTRRGERLHTGVADEHTQGFADDFTASFDILCRAYPVYSELRNVFDLAMIAGLVQSEGLAEAAGWRPNLFAASERLRTPALQVATQVETLATSRVVRKTQVLAAVSGGVWVEPVGPRAVAGEASFQRPASPPPNAGVWWWDAE